MEQKEMFAFKLQENIHFKSFRENFLENNCFLNKAELESLCRNWGRA